jgi:hypothetical protein
MSTSSPDELEEHPATGAGSLEQVREILFGPQHRELTRRLARTDVHFAAQAEELRREARRRLDLLDTFVRKELEGLTTTTEAQRSTQIAGLDQVARESREGIRSLEQRVARLEETMARAQREFREQLLDQAKSFVDEVRRAREELGAVIEREIVVAWGEALEPAAPPEPTPTQEDRGEAWERPSEAA